MSNSVIAPAEADELRTEIPHSARIYDYFLGGEDNFPADRAVADQIVTMLPGGPIGARANRRFLVRAVQHAAGLGIRQFLDLGAGLPSANATHQVAQQISPDARVVYTDNDPIVFAHARRLLGADQDGRTAFLQADFREPEAVLDAPETKELLDLSQPVALIAGALLHFILDSADPYALLDRYKQALPAGSVLILTHSSPDFVSPEVRAAVDRLYNDLRVDLASRTHDEIERFVTGQGWTPVGPGVVSVNEWYLDGEEAVAADRETSREDAAGYAAIAVKA